MPVQTRCKQNLLKTCKLFTQATFNLTKLKMKNFKKPSSELNGKEQDSTQNKRPVVRVLLQTPSELASNPQCPHGPMLLFERDAGLGTRFYACSAFRDRKFCPAYVNESDAQNYTSKHHLVSREFMEKLKLYSDVQESNVSSSSHSYCRTCETVFPKTSEEQHKDHDIIQELDQNVYKKPSSLICQRSHSKKEAQYHFAAETIGVMLSFLGELGITHALCVGVPTVFEALQEGGNIQSLLLDLDIRFRQFYPKEKYLAYNMFNHHFFEGSAAKQIFDEFLGGAEKKLALIVDPPFGVKTEVLASAINIIQNFHCDSKLKVFWIFPYFMEKQVKEALPDFQMLDYKVNYSNHSSFAQGPKGRKQGSPVRIFTNVNPELLPLPKEEGYRFCDLCKKYVSQENRHCSACNSCTSKDGRTYVHCDVCNRCVKPTWVHCRVCQRCFLPEHPCRGSPYPPAPASKKLKLEEDHVTSTTQWTISDLEIFV